MSHRNYVQPSDMVPPPDHNVGWFFRITASTLCMILGLFGCGHTYKWYKDVRNKARGYDNDRKVIEKFINDAHTTHGGKAVYPVWLYRKDDDEEPPRKHKFFE